MTKRFEYQRPSNVREACEMKALHGQQARYLAGGTDLLLDWRRGEIDFKYCIDLTFISDLGYVKQSQTALRVGALTTLSALERADKDNPITMAISNVAAQMATPQIRTYATVGGNLCNGSPASDLPVLFIALDGQAKLQGVSGERTVALEDFYKGVNQTVLDQDEMLIEIGVPVNTMKTATAYQRATRLVVDCNQVNAAVSLSVDGGGVVTYARIALGAVAPTPMRAKEAEKLLLGLKASQINEDLIRKTSGQAASETRPITDLRSSAAYRRYISQVLVKRCLEESIQHLQAAGS
jgi:carbon-monoxide dehydrogenase medium subunit